MLPRVNQSNRIMQNICWSIWEFQYGIYTVSIRASNANMNGHGGVQWSGVELFRREIEKMRRNEMKERTRDSRIVSCVCRENWFHFESWCITNKIDLMLCGKLPKSKLGNLLQSENAHSYDFERHQRNQPMATTMSKVTSKKEKLECSVEVEWKKEEKATCTNRKQQSSSSSSNKSNQSMSPQTVWRLHSSVFVALALSFCFFEHSTCTKRIQP